MRTPTFAFAFASLSLACCGAMAADAAPLVAAAPAPTPAVNTDQPIVPQVDRRDLAVPKYPSNDFEVGAFIGTYATQNFGASRVRGLRLGYAITEDFFVQGAYGLTQVSDQAFRQVFPAGIFPQASQKLSYYNLAVGINVLPGEVFLLGRHARPSALYLIGGVGSTTFVDRKRQTIHFGAGFRVFLSDWAALQIDARDHIFSIDLLGKQQSTHNLEFTAGLTGIF